MQPNAEKIRTLNDLFRSKGVGIGRTMMTSSIVALGADFQLAARLKVRTYTDFNNGNDPHGEHDFGAFELQGHKVFWKIELYERELVKQTLTGTPYEHRLIECTVHQCRVYPDDLPEPGCTRHSSSVPRAAVRCPHCTHAASPLARDYGTLIVWPTPT
jgi:hypothetical protein